MTPTSSTSVPSRSKDGGAGRCEIGALWIALQVVVLINAWMAFDGPTSATRGLGRYSPGCTARSVRRRSVMATAVEYRVDVRQGFATPLRPWRTRGTGCLPAHAPLSGVKSCVNPPGVTWPDYTASDGLHAYPVARSGSNGAKSWLLRARSANVLKFRHGHVEQKTPGRHDIDRTASGFDLRLLITGHYDPRRDAGFRHGFAQGRDFPRSRLLLYGDAHLARSREPPRNGTINRPPYRPGLVIVDFGINSP